MESLARPPHRRKHSAITNTFSFKNPYDDVLLFNGGGKKKSFEASEYAEIFSGSSSIPVIDLPGLDDRVGFGSGDSRSSKLDYSSIFGGLENDDVAVPYDELFNGSAKKTKPRIPANVPPPQQESVPPHPSRNKRRSSSDVPDKFYPKKDVPDKSADGVKQHFNMSFNKTSQRNNDETNGKTHIAEFHAVPGFTYFVDGVPHKQKPEVGPTPPPLKREVSRTWSFSAEFESLKGKGGSSYDKSHTPEKLQKVDEANLQSNFSKFPHSSRCSSNLSDDKDSVQSRVNSFAFKEDASGKIAGECSFDEEFDENSVAAVSAAALKKAIDQAQESIRIAKMIMERKRESHLDGSEPKLSGGMKVPGKKSKIVRGNGSKEKKREELDAIFNLFTGIDGKLALPLGRSDPLISAGNAAVERVRENVEMGKFYKDEKVDKEKVRENVEEAEMRRETTDFPGFAANVECGTANLRICQGDEVIEERENDMDDDGKCEEKFEECQEMHNMEDWTVLRSALDDSVNESCNLVGNEMLEQEKVEKESENVTESKENGETHGKNCDEEESGMRENEIQLKETLEEEVNERETNVFLEIREVEEKINEVHEPEIDVNKHNHASDGDEPRLSEEVVQNSVEERHIITSEYESAKTMMMEANNYAEVQKGAAFCEADEINNGFIDNNNNSDNSKGPTIFIEARANDTNTIFNETEETRGVELNNKAEEYNYNNHIHSISKLDDNEMPGMVSLRRTTSEETFIESELHNAFENLSFGENGENIDIIDSDSEEKPPGDDDGASRTTSEIHDNTAPEFDLPNVRQVLEQTSESDEGSVSTHENSDVSSAHDSEESPENAIEEKENELEMVSDERKHPEEHTEPKEMEKSSENSEIAEKNKEIEDHQQRVEAIKKRREREKDRKAVERAIREARERAFAEARERAERAAVEKAAAEVRQRAMAEAREKATVGKQAADKASIEAKLRAERAAVERATAEARQRALEKAKSLKTTESISTSSRSNGLKHSFSSSDLENGTSTESAQRRKARLERHQRIMERAAKALEEKNMRDSLAQKEQAERNRLAESLDADIKRWATGKEGNLRALLSTLQYILGSESGWQPISLTEIITTPAVKKAYRKATLYVHPDKLQQRGASIQQKYICEKVFDLLKAAWNRFNSEER